MENKGQLPDFMLRLMAAYSKPFIEKMELERYGLVDLSDDERHEIRGLIEQTIGPSPWGTNEFPKFHGCEWRAENGMSILAREGADVMRLYMYVTPIVVSEQHVGFWADFDGKHCISVFSNADLLAGEGELCPAAYGVEARCKPIQSIDINDPLSEGDYHFPALQVTSPLQEILHTASSGLDGATQPDAPAYSTYSYRPHSGLLRVLHLPWFTYKDFDTGYEWITTLLRHPHTGHIYGAGFRIPQFELQDDDKSIKRWFRLW